MLPCFLILDLQISAGKGDKGLKLYDPGYLNTAPVRSAISYIDGDEGILRYRGYPIEELAEKSTFTEVSYLISEYCIFASFYMTMEFFASILTDDSLKKRFYVTEDNWNISITLLLVKNVLRYVCSTNSYENSQLPSFAVVKCMEICLLKVS